MFWRKKAVSGEVKNEIRKDKMKYRKTFENNIVVVTSEQPGKE